MSTINRSVAWLLLIIFSLSFLSGCGQIVARPTETPTPTDTPIPPTDTPVPPTDTPQPTPTETPIPPPTDTLPPPPTPTQILPTNTPYGQKPIYIYFIQTGTGGNVGCGDSLVPVQTNLGTTDDTIKNVQLALGQLFLYHTQTFGELYNPLYASKLSVAGVDYSGTGRVVVDLSGEIGKTGESCDSGRILAMLQATIRQFRGVLGNPEINLNGSGIKNFLKMK